MQRALYPRGLVPGVAGREADQDERPVVGRWPRRPPRGGWSFWEDRAEVVERGRERAVPRLEFREAGALDREGCPRVPEVLDRRHACGEAELVERAQDDRLDRAAWRDKCPRRAMN